MKRFHKKASLNLSIEAIVILIFAVIMLGLGLGLINFIFGAAREKVGGSLGAAQLTNPPSTDEPLTMERNINVKFKDEAQVQIGYYNKESGTKYGVEPWVTGCKTAKGKIVAPDAMPTISTVSEDEVEPGGIAGWNAIIRLPDIAVVDGAADADEYTGALIAGQYICKVSVYGGTSSDYLFESSLIDGPSLESSQFFLKVTS